MFFNVFVTLHPARATGGRLLNGQISLYAGGGAVGAVGAGGALGSLGSDIAIDQSEF